MTVRDYLLSLKETKEREVKLGMSVKELQRKLDEEMTEKLRRML